MIREREELLSEQSELSNSGEGCKVLPSPDATRHPLPREGKFVIQNNKTYPCHLSQMILNRLFGRVLEKEGEFNVPCVVSIGSDNYNCISEAPYSNNNNCWAGAKKACSDIGMRLPDKNTLYQIFVQRYEMVNDKNYWNAINFSAWSADEFENGSNVAYRVVFADGQIARANKTAQFPVFCIDK